MSSKIKIQSVKGMPDILPESQEKWDFFIQEANRVLKSFNFRKIITPILEDIKLFKRGVGSGTDIVEKEMFRLTTKGGDRLALRPEGTAGTVRAYINNGMNVKPKPVKLYYIGPMFRYEQPQAGRLRQHHQLGFEIIGSREAVIDAEIIAIGWQILQNLKIKALNIQINSIGCPKCRPDYIILLQEYYRRKSRSICYDCRRRLRSNPLRVLDCKNPKCIRLATQAPNTVDSLCGECHDHFRETLEFLDELDLPYALNSRLVRGLDYYTKTVFELWPDGEDGFSLGSGGRYDNLVELLGGSDTPAAGMSMGIERIIERIKDIALEREPVDVFLAQLGVLAKMKSLKLFLELEQRGIKTAEAFAKNSLKSQLKLANRLEAKYTLILGQKEALEGSIILRNMETGVQETLGLDKIIEELNKKIKR